MRLACMRLRNFRCYKDEVSIRFEDCTALIGKNDVGKSSIMDALDIFLNDILPDKHDATKGGDGKDMTIICEFDRLPQSIIIDDVNPTSLAGEFLLNAAGRLEIHKTFNGTAAKPTMTSVSALALHPSASEVADLIALKNADLKKRAKEVGADLTGVDQKLNAPIRQRIREKCGALQLKERLVSLEKDNAKSVWETLKVQMPAFALLRSDRASTDQDAEAQDPMKAAVKEALKAKELELNSILQFVEQEVKRVADKTLEKAREMDSNLASTLNPQFAAPKWEMLFKATLTGDEEIPINKRGSGVRRLLLLSFFRAKAELQAQERNAGSIIYGIEEPETSQHPNNQRLLVRALLDISMSSQVVITTHTPMLARTLPDKCLRYVGKTGAGGREVLEGGEATNQQFAQSLGVLPDNSVKLFIGVEGGNDINFLKGISYVLRQGGEDVLDLERMETDGEIIFVPLGGSSLALWVSRLKDLNRPEFHLYDRDLKPPAAPKYENEAKKVNARARCRAEITSKRELENYIHWQAIKQAYAANGISLPITSAYGEFDDVPAEIAKLVHAASGSTNPWDKLPEEDRDKKASSAKRVLNDKAVRLMTKAQLNEADPKGEVQGWLAGMKTLVNAPL